MQPIQINVQVTIGVSQELNALLLPMVRNLQAVPAVAAEPAKEPEAKPAVTTQVADPVPAEDPAPAPTRKSARASKAWWRMRWPGRSI